MRRAAGKTSAMVLAAMLAMAALSFFLPAARAADAPVEGISKAVPEQAESEEQEIVEALGITTFVLLLCTATLGYLTAHGRKRLFKFHITSAVLTALSAATHGTLVLVLL